MSETLTAAFNLTDEQRKKLVTLINYIQDNDSVVKSNFAMYKFILTQSNNSIQWKELQIGQFKSRPSSLNLPEDAEQQQRLFQIISAKAEGLGYGKIEV